LPRQLGERPGGTLDNPIDTPRVSGLSIKNPRVRIIHTTDPAKKGGSMYLQQADPWLGYKWGWSLTQRSSASATASTAMPASSTASSCPPGRRR
jgi:hypothetical protein